MFFVNNEDEAIASADYVSKNTIFNASRVNSKEKMLPLDNISRNMHKEAQKATQKMLPFQCVRL